jgi:hypothetical protein
VMGIPFHIREKKIPGSVDEPTADGRSPVRTLARTCSSGLVPPNWDGTRKHGTRGKKVAGGTSGPGGSCKNRSRRDGSLTFNIRGECQTGPTARAGWRSDAGAWSQVPEARARLGHEMGLEHWDGIDSTTRLET